MINECSSLLYIPCNDHSYLVNLEKHTLYYNCYYHYFIILLLQTCSHLMTGGSRRWKEITDTGDIKYYCSICSGLFFVLFKAELKVNSEIEMFIWKLFWLLNGSVFLSSISWDLYSPDKTAEPTRLYFTVVKMVVNLYICQVKRRASGDTQRWKNPPK